MEWNDRWRSSHRTTVVLRCDELQRRIIYGGALQGAYKQSVFTSYTRNFEPRLRHEPGLVCILLTTRSLDSQVLAMVTRQARHISH